MARILLVHGAFGGASVWDRVIPELERRGHHVQAIDLPGSGEDPTPVAEVTLDAYASRVCATLADGPPAVLVGHSMGGVVITQAAARCPDQLAALVYVCAFVPGDGQSLLDLAQLPEGAGDQVQANMVLEGDPPVARMPATAAREALLACCDDEQAAWATATLRPQPVMPFTEPVTLGGEAFASLPRAYVSCTQDRAINPALQRRMLAAAGCDPVVELNTDHFPMASRTGELVAALDEIVRGQSAGPA
jgi:pimeloyl-ACP methyl ester carboxylesterase